MATRMQIARLAERIDALAARFAPPEPPFERWVVEAGRAYQLENPEEVITYAELAVRPGRRIEHIMVHADNGRPAACCLPGGACYALHGSATDQRVRPW